MRRLFLAMLATALALVVVPAANAESVETALMPGKVIEGHAKLEAQCKNCHVPFKKAAQSGLCLDCHKDVAKDVRMRGGYHGRLQEDQCRTCHTEHKGRNVNIAPLDERKFEHKLTDFALKGAHAGPKVKCADCHKPNKKHRDAPSACVACHKKDDAHKGKLGAQCANCHTERDWKEARFDHSTTKFPLVGKHLSVGCKDCHKDPLFRGAPTVCYACHKRDDKHKGKYGDRCQTCHTEKDWKMIVFDHDRRTKYPLRGKHRLARCESCHSGVLYTQKLATTCIGCHKKDDKHKGQEGTACGSCHNEVSWNKTFFDHGLTAFPLLGAHAKVKCSACHASAMFKDAETECVACHRRDDAHKGRLGSRCEGCHNARDWALWSFDHNRQTHFKLDGAHQRLDCLACHKKPMEKVTASSSCFSCHDVDDVHDGTFGRMCQRCHVTSSFKKIKSGMAIRRAP